MRPKFVKFFGMSKYRYIIFIFYLTPQKIALNTLNDVIPVFHLVVYSLCEIILY